MGIPPSPTEWAPVANQLAECLISGSERRDTRPDVIVVFLCQDPAEGESGHQAMERLRPLAQRLRTACGALDVPVLEALCISDGRYWSYCCPDERCCPIEGNPLALPGTTVMAAAAAYAGIRVRGSLRDMEARLRPWGSPAGAEQEKALDSAGAVLVSRILDADGRGAVAGETLALARELMERLVRAPAATTADIDDDRLISCDEAAALILGLQDRETRTGPRSGWRAARRRRPYGCGGRSPAAAWARTWSTPRHLSLWPAGSPGPPATNPVPGSRSGSLCGPIPTTRSPSCCIRRATRAWTRKRCGAASATNAACVPGATVTARARVSAVRPDGTKGGVRNGGRGGGPRAHRLRSGRGRQGRRPAPQAPVRPRPVPGPAARGAGAGRRDRGEGSAGPGAAVDRPRSTGPHGGGRGGARHRTSFWRLDFARPRRTEDRRDRRPGFARTGVRASRATRTRHRRDCRTGIASGGGIGTVTAEAGSPTSRSDCLSSGRRL